MTESEIKELSTRWKLLITGDAEYRNEVVSQIQYSLAIKKLKLKLKYFVEKTDSEDTEVHNQNTDSLREQNLPLSCVDDSYPFSCTETIQELFIVGVFNDDVLNERDPFKCYIVIYTCDSTREFVLHVVPDGSAVTFINSLKKFISRRSCPANLLLFLM